MNKCKLCNKETNNPSYCSKSCSAKHTNKLFPKRKTKRLCIVCQDSVISYKHARCEVHHKEYIANRFEQLKELTLESYWNKDSLKNLHASSKNAHIRAQARSNFKDLLAKPCYFCGYSKHVELCHIKPISKFNPTDKVKDVNSYENLIQMCRNCHWEFDNGYLFLDFPEQAKFTQSISTKVLLC